MSARSDGFANGRIQWSAIHIAGDTTSRGGAFFDSAAATDGENNHRGAGGVINGERKKKLPLDVDLLFHQHGFDWKLPNLHRQHAGRVRANIIWLFDAGHPANARASGGPGLDLDDHFAAHLAAHKSFGRRHGLISGRSGAATRNLESVNGKNGFALIFVKSRHGYCESEP